MTWAAGVREVYRFMQQSDSHCERDDEGQLSGTIIKKMCRRPGEAVLPGPERGLRGKK